MITDGHSYLRRDASGNYIPVKNRSLGDVWEQRFKAQNVLSNCINKNFRKRYRVVEIADEIISKSNKKMKIIIKSKDNVAKQIENEFVEENYFGDLTAKIDKFSDFIQNAEQRKDILLNILSEVDKEITDINHYIELGDKFNAYQGWLAFNMLRSKLRKRRKIKDELYILMQLGKCKVNSQMLMEIKNSIDKLSTREYQPRILKELFK